MSGVFKKTRKTGKKICADILRGIVTQDPEHVRLGMLAMLSKWKGGDVSAGVFVRDCLDGKPHQSIEMDVDVTDNDINTASESELLEALRNRMAGILPQRVVSSVERDGESGPGSDSQTH